MLCPKCHQPTDGDEEYICCADATIQWRCTSCAKVAEGFAFPYGLCPHCGGKLEIVAERHVVEGEALAAIRAAFAIELGGLAFYEQASRETTDAGLRDLFGRLADMEREHMTTLTRRYHANVPAPSRDFRMDLAALAEGIKGDPNEPAGLFLMAIAFEERAVAFFSERSEGCAEGSVERQLYRELAAEEREHVSLLRTEFDRWKAGKPGLL